MYHVCFLCIAHFGPRRCCNVTTSIMCLGAQLQSAFAVSVTAGISTASSLLAMHLQAAAGV